MSGFVGYRSSVEFQQEWEQQYGEQEKSPVENFVVFVGKFVKQFVQKFRFVGQLGVQLSEKKYAQVSSNPEKQKEYEIFCAGWDSGVAHFVELIEKHGVKKAIKIWEKEIR